MSHEHRPGKACRFRTLKACDEAYQDAQAASQVALALRVVAEGRADTYRGNKTEFGQLVRIMSGRQADFLTDDGVPSKAAFTRRLREQVGRHREQADGRPDPEQRAP